ncbi:sexual stage-specific kinase [Cryptosporidium sp. chipmunk genotype I]|uniref:sexual stage-specific kinase n=1 Tax=Cryptosporidium sp. chipmunk genotype I TaxID=1280935 RepID=UPI003519E9F5|nr:sexual stage-specific kinase [Cryptosporidium sp. chipmunk genotype I]
MHKDSLNKYLKREYLKIRSLLVFNSGGIELHRKETRNIVTEKLKNNRISHKKNKVQKKNIVISMENLHSLLQIDDNELFFYYGETLESQRHGWGFLADKNKIVYEGMWYKDQAVGLYISQSNFMVEFGYKDYFYRNSNSYQSQIIWGKETEIILDKRAQQNNMIDEYFNINDFNENDNFRKILDSYLTSNLKQNEPFEYLNTSLLNNIKEFQCIGHNLFTRNLENLNRLNNEIICQSIILNNSKDSYNYYGRKKIDILTENDKENLNVTENNTDNKKRSIRINRSFTYDRTCNNDKTLIFKQLISTPIYACDCYKWSNEVISLILLSNGLLEEAIAFQNCKLTGSDIPLLNDQLIKELGISDSYSRKFILRLFQQFWGFLDYMDLSLIENSNVKNLSTLPYINRTEIELGSYISGNPYCVILNAKYKAQKVICKILVFNTDNYEELGSVDRIKCRNSTNNILEYCFDNNHNNSKSEDSENVENLPICYIYRHRRDCISKENLSKYVPTSVKMRNWEARILSYLSPHPNIVQCLGVTQIYMGCEALLLENCEGGSMDQYLINDSNSKFQKSRSKFSANRLEILSWLRDIAMGMEHVHKLGILHRDLKLSNFFISKVGQEVVGKVGDFGIAISIDSKLGYSPFTDYGNVYYAAPEVLRKEGFFKESDVWSFGMSMLEALTKSFVFDGFFPGLAMVVNAANIDAIQKKLDVPIELNMLIKSILEPDRKMRPSFELISCELSKIIENSRESAFKKLLEFHAFK